MGAAPPPHLCGRTESCTLRILTDAFLVLTEKEGEGIKAICCGGYFLAEGLGNIPHHPVSKASPQDEHGVERTTLPRGVGLRKPHIISITFITSLFKSPLAILKHG